MRSLALRYMLLQLVVSKLSSLFRDLWYVDIGFQYFLKDVVHLLVEIGIFYWSVRFPFPTSLQVLVHGERDENETYETYCYVGIKILWVDRIESLYPSLWF